uniref:Phospholipase A2 family protein n=1 Tax=Davidia involucrata TaxID=16924 RepID=A0A5B7CCR6_DAVIN
MDFGFLSNMPWFGVQPNKDMPATHPNKDIHSAFASTSNLMEAPKQRAHFNVKLWGWSFLSFVPWAINARVQMPSTVNKELKRHAQPRGVGESGAGSVPFRPYVSKVPWHTGARAFLSQLFPRYGHYCGPNWSSGKDGGSLLWDKRPIDWLDFCCYCHDIGYDSHNQAELLKADLAFLECLERPRMSTKGDARVAHLYKTMCISGLRNILIPYRKNLLKLQSVQLSIGFGWLSNMKWKGWNLQRT